MVINKGAIVLLIISFILIKWTRSDNQENTRLKDALRNSTSTNLMNQNNGRGEDNKDDNIFKIEAKKMLGHCGGDSNESEEMDGFGNHNTKNSLNKNDGSSLNNRKSNNYRNNNRQGDTQYGNSNNEDGYWNTYGSQNRYNSNKGQGDQNNRNSNTNRRGPSYNGQEFDDQRYQGSQNQYGSGTTRSRGGQYDRNGDGNQNNKYGLYGNYGSSSNRDTNSGSEHGGYNSNNQNEYNGESSHNRNGYDSQNVNNRNSYDDQGFGYGNDNYGQTFSQGDLNNNRRDNGGNRAQNTDRGYQSSNGNNKNSYYPYSSLGGDRHRNDGCDQNGDSSIGYLTGGSFGLTREQRRPRSKRNSKINYFNKNEDKNDENNDNQLDNDRTPSETMLIKWLQEHVKGSDMVRIKSLRDARRCFARLTTSDTEDGCDFSKELAKCLELDLE